MLPARTRCSPVSNGNCTCVGREPRHPQTLRVQYAALHVSNSVNLKSYKSSLPTLGIRSQNNTLVTVCQRWCFQSCLSFYSRGSLYSPPLFRALRPPQTSSNLFTMTHRLRKRAVGIQLKCLLPTSELPLWICYSDHGFFRLRPFTKFF